MVAAQETERDLIMNIQSTLSHWMGFDASNPTYVVVMAIIIAGIMWLLAMLMFAVNSAITRRHQLAELESIDVRS